MPSVVETDNGPRIRSRTAARVFLVLALVLGWWVYDQATRAPLALRAKQDLLVELNLLGTPPGVVRHDCLEMSGAGRGAYVGCRYGGDLGPDSLQQYYDEALRKRGWWRCGQDQSGDQRMTWRSYRKGEWRAELTHTKSEPPEFGITLTWSDGWSWR